jgi:hypothetical protein
LLWRRSLDAKPARRDPNFLPAVFKDVTFRTGLAKPEVYDGVGICGPFAQGVLLMKAEEAPAAVIKRGEAIWVGAFRNYVHRASPNVGDLSCGCEFALAGRGMV